MGCGSSSSSSARQSESPTTAAGSKSQPTGAAASKQQVSEAAAAAKDVKKEDENEILLPADRGGPPPERSSSRVPSRASLDAGVEDATAESAAVEASASESTAAEEEPNQQQQQQPPPPPPPPPAKAAEEVSSTGQSAEAEAEAEAQAETELEPEVKPESTEQREVWHEQLLSELNRQRMQVFSAELNRLNLRRELCAIAQRLADWLAERQATVVSPAVDKAELDRVKNGVRCQLMPRVLTSEESQNLNLYLAGLMAGMKAKEEDLVDREQLEDSDAAFWTLNGSFGCARAAFEIVDSAAESDNPDAAATKQDFVVLVLAFCPESRLASLQEESLVDGDNHEPEVPASASDSSPTEEAPKPQVELKPEPELEPEPEEALPNAVETEAS